MEEAPAIVPRRILPLIVFAQFAGVSVWFAGNAVLGELTLVLELPPDALASITASVQLGFIFGTLVFAFFLIADRFRPSRVFGLCSLFGALFNAAVLLPGIAYEDLLLFRFLTGFCLAGIYPVGMKIAADWYQGGLGKALGYLVGALVLGTAFPHLSRFLLAELPWQRVMLLTSILSLFGGLAVSLLVPDGPYRKKALVPDLRALKIAFRNPSVSGAALGYFGHMWELYAFWTFLPLWLQTRFGNSPGISLQSFAVIGIGAIACVVGGHLSLRSGSKRVAAGMMWISGICCLLSPWAFQWSEGAFLLFMLIWGFAVVGDSPQFSALMARNAASEYKGSVLTFATAIGFGITILSINLLSRYSGPELPVYLFYLLAPGPFIGLLGLRRVAN